MKFQFQMEDNIALFREIENINPSVRKILKGWEKIRDNLDKTGMFQHCQRFSATVASGMEVCIEDRSLLKQAIPTVEFIRKMNQLWDCCLAEICIQRNHILPPL